MKKHARRTPLWEEPGRDGLRNAEPSFDLPGADEFVYTDEEVREVCAEFRDLVSFDHSS